MNLLLIDDHFCARECVACLLKQLFPELQVFEAESVDEGLAELRSEFPNLCVTMYSGVDDRELVFEALRQGAMGFIVNSVSLQAFALALRNMSCKPVANCEIIKTISIEIKYQPHFFA